MIIELPEKFNMKSPNNSKKEAYVENGELKIRTGASFRKIMTELTYEMKGKKHCYYCQKEMEEGEESIDHIYPQDFGGPTITNNLVPSCKKCNVDKGNLNRTLYEMYLRAKKEGRGSEFMVDVQKYHAFIRKWKDFDIPEEWITKKDVSGIIVIFNLGDNYNGSKYEKIKKYYEMYNKFQKPIIVDKNNFLLDGFLNLMYAKNYNLASVPTVQLENVEVIL